MKGRNIFKKEKIKIKNTNQPNNQKNNKNLHYLKLFLPCTEFAIKSKEVLGLNYFPQIRNKWCSAGFIQVVYLRKVGKETKA